MFCAIFSSAAYVLTVISLNCLCSQNKMVYFRLINNDFYVLKKRYYLYTVKKSGLNVKGANPGVAVRVR